MGNTGGGWWPQEAIHQRGLLVNNIIAGIPKPPLRAYTSFLLLS